MQAILSISKGKPPLANEPLLVMFAMAKTQGSPTFCILAPLVAPQLGLWLLMFLLLHIKLLSFDPFQVGLSGHRIQGIKLSG